MNNGWPILKLAEVAESISTGPFGSMLHKSDYVTDGIPLVNPVNMVNSRIIASSKMMIDEATKCRLSKYVLRNRDIVVGRRGELGRCAIVTEKEDGWLCGTGSCFIRLSKKVDERFFALYFSSSRVRKLLDQSSVGTTMSNLNHGILNVLPVPVPSLAEQRRIVGILDEAFAAIATAKANTEKNLQNARALFESLVDSIFTELQNTAPGKPLAACVESISTGPFGSLLHKSDYEEGGVPLVNPINISGDRIVPDARKAVGPQTAHRLARYVLRKGDIVTARRGEIGRCAAVSENQDGWLCGTGSFFIRPGSGVDSRFLTHLLRSKIYRSQLERLSARATMPSIGNDDLANLMVHIPSLDEQTRIESRLGDLGEQVAGLASLYQRKLAALDELKKSLLHQAFTGQL